MSALPLSVMTVEDLDEAWGLVEQAFGAAPHPDDRAVEHAVVDPARFLVARDGRQVVGTAGSFALRMAVPGAVLPVAGVTWVGVLPTHRRRGLLTGMMTRLLAERHEAGEAVAALWASEGAIYQRFGYGPACGLLTVEVPRGAALAMPVEPGGLRLVTPDSEVLAPLHEAVAARTPGEFLRTPAFWRFRLHDAEHRRAGASPLRCVVTEEGDGYALYATTSDWGPAGPVGQVRLRELVATTPQAHARLWRYLLDHDLTVAVTGRIAVEDPLLHLLTEPRGAQARLGDGLWVRPVEVGAALSARTYATPVDVVLEVTDPTCPWNAGRWRLSGGPAGAVCGRTRDAADLALDVRDVGAVLLGGARLQVRAAAGRVEELTPGALVAASTAFGPVGAGPHCSMIF